MSHPFIIETLKPCSTLRSYTLGKLRKNPFSMLSTYIIHSYIMEKNLCCQSLMCHFPFFEASIEPFCNAPTYLGITFTTRSCIIRWYLVCHLANRCCKVTRMRVKTEWNHWWLELKRMGWFEFSKCDGQGCWCPN